MRIPGPLLEGTFLQRINRFTCLVEVQGKQDLAHLANSGRLKELLWPGVPVFVRPAGAVGRKTLYDLALVRLDTGLVSVDARLPSALVQEAILTGTMMGFETCTEVRREVNFGAHRLDLLAHNPGPCLIEAKSITLVVGGCALFPDAPTLRGTGHMGALLRFCREGGGASVVFVVQRDDASLVTPNDKADPAFGKALREAAAGGVTVRGFRCRVSLQEIRLDREIPVVF